MTYLLSPDEVAAAYVELRTRVVALLREAGEGVADTPVPHCPAWTVKMVASPTRHTRRFSGWHFTW